MQVALASCRELPEPDPDEAPLVAALGAAGIDCAVLGWDDPAADWTAPLLTLLRATWNYPGRPAEFLAWAEAVARAGELRNPIAAVRWNLHKGYLVDLARAGVPVAPTELVRRGSRQSLAEIAGDRGWPEVVVKPAISAASYRTLRVRREALARGEAHLRTLLADGDALVQRYLPAVEDRGERALVWIDGELTHAVRKSPRFGGQEESVSETSVEITAAEAGLAERTVARAREAVGEPLLYARIDLAPGPGGEPLLMELELIEPSLFFRQSDRALERFVAAVRHELAGLG